MSSPPPSSVSTAPTWQASLRGAYTSINELQREGLLPAALTDARRARLSRHQLRIPRGLAAQFDRRDLLGCPLYRQAVPWAGEDDPAQLPAWAEAQSLRLYGRPLPWQADAIGDVARLAAPRLTHRYGARALLHVTHACALYCRYCFRKTTLHTRSDELYGGPLAAALTYLMAHDEIEEVVLTGGDPMTMSDESLRRLLAALAEVPHLKIVRLHTRMPAVLPERFTPTLAEVLAGTRLQVAVACHVNHPREWGDAARAGIATLRTRGIALLHQAVLLRGINDDADTLTALWQGAYTQGVVPFSLHHPDLSPNTWGYRLSIAQGRTLMMACIGRVAGPALPRYVLDLPGGQGKIDLLGYAVQPDGAVRREDGVSARVWNAVVPTTRAATQEPVQYLDVWPTSA